MLPPSKPTSDPGEGSVVKISVSDCSLLLAGTNPGEEQQLRALNGDKPGNVMSMPVTVPAVTSTLSVPENEHSLPAEQVPKVCPEALPAVPNTLNVVIVSAWEYGAEATKRAAAKKIATDLCTVRSSPQPGPGMQGNARFVPIRKINQLAQPGVRYVKNADTIGIRA
jgi:hypothetical protein